MTLTKARKIEICQKAIASLKKEKQGCICHEVWFYLYPKKRGKPFTCANSRKVFELFPELLKYKPKHDSFAWFSWYKYRKRINILKKVINDLNK